MQWTKTQLIPAWADICPSRDESENQEWVPKDEAEHCISELEERVRILENELAWEQDSVKEFLRQKRHLVKQRQNWYDKYKATLKERNDFARQTTASVVRDVDLMQQENDDV